MTALLEVAAEHTPGETEPWPYLAVSTVVRGVPHLEWASGIVTLSTLLAVTSFSRLCFYAVVDFDLSV